MWAVSDTSDIVKYHCNTCPAMTRYLQEAQTLIHKEKKDMKEMLDDKTIDEMNDLERAFIEKQKHNIDLSKRHEKRKTPCLTVSDLRKLFGTTLNQLSRDFITHIMNNMWMYMDKRQNMPFQKLF
jgi:hypothetical protein